MKTFQGGLTAKGKNFAIVVSRFNEFITKRLLESAVSTLKRAGAEEKKIVTVWIPGALEAPQLCMKLAKSGKYHAVIVIACVLRGDTYHYECVSNELTRGISQASLETGVPVATGVITADNLEQAIDRAGLKAGNKGEHAALAALELANLNQQLKKEKVL